MIVEFYMDSVRLRFQKAGKELPESVVPEPAQHLIEEDIKNGISPLARMVDKGFGLNKTP